MRMRKLEDKGGLALALGVIPSTACILAFLFSQPVMGIIFFLITFFVWLMNSDSAILISFVFAIGGIAEIVFARQYLMGAIWLGLAIIGYIMQNIYD